MHLYHPHSQPLLLAFSIRLAVTGAQTGRRFSGVNGLHRALTLPYNSAPYNSTWMQELIAVMAARAELWRR